MHSKHVLSTPMLLNLCRSSAVRGLHEELESKPRARVGGSDGNLEIISDLESDKLIRRCDKRTKGTDYGKNA